MLLEILILLMAVPIGLLIAWMTRDELIQGRIWFRYLMILSVGVGVWFWLVGVRYVAWSAGFVFVVALIGLVKSGDTKWTKKRI